MKKILFLVLITALTACDNNQGYTIKIQMDELAGSKLILQQSVSGEMTAIDSVVLDSSGLGEISGSVLAPEMMYLLEQGKRRPLSIFMDNYNYTISGTSDDYKVTADGGAQLTYNSYKDETADFQKMQQAIIEEYNIAKAGGLSDDSLQLIVEKFYTVNDEKMAFDSVYIIENPETVVSLFILRGMYYQLNEEELEEKLALFDSTLHETVYYTFMYDHLEKMRKVKIGEKYTDFELPDTAGNPVKLSDIAGKGVLLIDFWASWCQPCRQANPDVLKIYNELHEQGFDILGVSLDRTKEDWIKAIEADGLVWHHISDIKFWKCEAAKLYAVSSIPHTVLLDKNGIIAARNLEKDELKAKILELLEK